MLTTLLRRLTMPVLVFLAWTPVANAWSWPVQGPVLQAFSYDETHPYASGQHRGIDIGAEAAGENVVAPASGTVSFAGTVPTNGKSVTIETPDGYSVTLTHLGSIVVAKGAAVTEGDAVGTIGPSGTPEVAGPYVHLGIRLTTDPNGYLDPLTLLPPPAESAPEQSSSTPSTTASTPASAAPATPRRSTVQTKRTSPSHGESRPQPSARRPAVRAHARPSARPARTQRPSSESNASTRRPIVEPAAPRPSAHVAQVRPSQHEAPSGLIPLLCNGAAALVALVAALAARRRLESGPIAGAQILHLPRPVSTRRAA
jgi:hypothetical protein